MIIVENAQNILTILATITGIYVAISGLNSWRRETIGRRDIELCQSVIEKFYEAEHYMNILRSPGSFSSEGEDRRKEEGEPAQEKERRDSLFVPLARLNGQKEFWSEFFSYKFRMRALFGENAVEAFSKVDEAYRSFRAAALVRYQSLKVDPKGLEWESRMQFEQKIWAGLTDPDPIADKMREAINDMEAICIPIVRSTRQSIWCSRFCKNWH